MTRSRIAFIGLGAIGLPMAESIARAGFDIVGIEPSEAGRDRAAAAGLRTAADADGIGDAATLVVMVATADQLAAAVDAALVAGVGRGSRWVIMSTVGPDAVRVQAERIAAAGGTVVDAPVSGGIARASRGELALFVSGAPEVVADVEPVLRAMGVPRIVGDAVGDGQSVKIVNQHLCAVHIAAAAEALALAESLGLDPEFVLDVVGAGAAASFMLADRGPRMLQSPDAPVLSQIGIFVKDAALVADAASAASADVPVLAAARERFLLADGAGLRTRDDSSVIATYRAEDAS